MNDLNVKQLSQELQDAIAGMKVGAKLDQSGIVTRVGDGIVSIYGLATKMSWVQCYWTLKKVSKRALKCDLPAKLSKSQSVLSSWDVWLTLSVDHSMA
jgi:ABC-type enterochelin transport system substrate-binding protein